MLALAILFSSSVLPNGDESGMPVRVRFTTRDAPHFAKVHLYDSVQSTHTLHAISYLIFSVRFRFFKPCCHTFLFDPPFSAARHRHRSPATTPTPWLRHQGGGVRFVPVVDLAISAHTRFIICISLHVFIITHSFSNVYDGVHSFSILLFLIDNATPCHTQSRFTLLTGAKLPPLRA